MRKASRPSARWSASDSAKEAPAVNVMTSALKSDPAPSDRKHRRIFTDADKRAIVLETETARCNGLPGGPRAWARHYRPLSMARGAMLRQKQTRKSGDCHCRRRTARDITAPIVLHDLLQPPDGMTAVELDYGRRVFAPIGSDPETVRWYVLERGAR